MAAESEKLGICPPPFFFQLEGSLQMEKSSPLTSLSETEYDEKTGEGQARKQAELRAASVLARSLRRLINPKEDSYGSSPDLTAVRHEKCSKLKHLYNTKEQRSQNTNVSVATFKIMILRHFQF